MEDRDPINKIVPIRQHMQANGQMTRLGNLLLQPVVPSEPPPQGLLWTCSICGPIEPLFVPYGKGRWIRRRCACEKAAREAREQAEMLDAWKVQQKQRTFAWLGRGWEEEHGITEKTFDTFMRARQPKAYLKAVKFAHDPAGNLIFHGGYGTGKTHLAAAICASLREKGIASLFASATKLFAAYSDKMNNHEDHWSLIKQAISTPVFVLDDVDKARHTPPREEMFSLIFDERAKTRRPIVLSTNKLDDLAEYIGAANASRLMIGLEVAEMVGRDYREEL